MKNLNLNEISNKHARVNLSGQSMNSSCKIIINIYLYDSLFINFSHAVFHSNNQSKTSSYIKRRKQFDVLKLINRINLQQSIYYLINLHICICNKYIPC